MLYIFDWDGTLSDSLSNIAGSFQKAAKALNLPIKTDSQVRQIIGLGLDEGIEILYPGMGPEVLLKIREYYGQNYRQISHQYEQLFAGSISTLKQLAEEGNTLAVATGKSRVGLDRAMDRSQTRHFFECTKTADDAPSKPHPQMILDILNVTGFDADDALMIGDTEFDLEMAQRAGIRSIGTSYGAHKVEQLEQWKPIQIIDNIAELLNLQLES